MTATSATVAGTAIRHVGVGAYRIATDAPESDGTIAWDTTTIVVVEILAGEVRGLGYAYADAAAAHLVQDTLAGVVEGRDALAVTGAWEAMVKAVRNIGRPGIASSAIAAVDVALWDLKARLLGLPLAALLGPVREGVPIYGSGGFTSYDVGRLQEQLAGWADAGIAMVKMKVGATRSAIASASPSPARRSAPAASCSSTPTGPTSASRRCSWRSASPTSR